MNRNTKRGQGHRQKDREKRCKEETGKIERNRKRQEKSKEKREGKRTGRSKKRPDKATQTGRAIQEKLENQCKYDYQNTGRGKERTGYDNVNLDAEIWKFGGFGSNNKKTLNHAEILPYNYEQYLDLP